MASLSQKVRSDGTIAYRVLFRHNGKQRSETFDTPAAQKRFKNNADRLGIDAALAILDTYGDSSDGLPTLAEYMTHYVDTRSGITEGTRHTNRRIAGEIAQTPLGQTPLDSITRAAVAGWIRDLERGGFAGKTIRNRHSLLSAALSAAVADELIPYNRAKGARIAETERKEMVILTPDEVQRILDFAPDHYKPVVQFLWGTGARFGEMAALKVGDVRLTETPATVSIVRAWKKGPGATFVLGAPKTRRGRRTISLPSSLVDILRPLLNRPPDEWLFLNAHGNPVQQSSFGKEWGRWRRKADLGKSPRVHDLRHSHASYMIGRGMNLLDLQHRLGHESLKTTGDTYGHLLPEAQVQAARIAESMFTPSPVAQIERVADIAQ